MLSDPLVIGGESLPRTGEDNGGALYSFFRADGLSRITTNIRHTTSGGKNGSLVYDRANVEVLETIFATAVLPEKKRKIYFVVENLPGDAAGAVVVLDNLADYIIAGANANALRILKGES